MKANILVVDDEKDLCDPVADTLEKAGHDVQKAYSGEDALELLRTQIFDLMLLDYRLPGMDGKAVLSKALEIDPDLLVIMFTAHGTVQSAVDAMKGGAYDYLSKPVELEQLRFVVTKALETQKLKREVSRFRRLEDSRFQEDVLYVSDPQMQEVKHLIELVADTPRTSVLIQGETGTGKELVAKAIHNLSARREKSMVSINCTAVNENLSESELFGHEKGAFTDAKNLRKGLFELANGGSIFLDEISSMNIGLQPKLLRVLETRTIRRVGGSVDLAVDVRIIAATNQNLENLVKNNQFREDLYYRLKVMVINVPPLRDRKPEILPLAKVFINKCNAELKKNILGISDEAKRILESYHWPGNVRELKNVIERASILSQGKFIEIDHFPRELSSVEIKTSEVKPPSPRAEKEIEVISEETISLQDVEKKYIIEVLKKYDGNKSKAARMLNISRSTLREKLKLYGIS